MPNHTYTPRYHLVYPLSTASTNVPVDIENPLDTIDSIITPTYKGVAATRPASGTPTTPSATGTTGRVWFSTDTGTISFDNGSAWLPTGPINASGGRITQSIPGASAAAGSTGFSADAGHTHSREAWGLVGDYKASGTPSAGSSGRVAQSDHVHPGLTVGVPIPWPGASVPSGYIRLMGQVVPRATHPLLFAAYGTTWNISMLPTTTFQLPHMENRVLAGAGTQFTIGHYYGANTVIISHTQLPGHRHNLPSLAHSHTVTVNATATTHAHYPATYQFILGSTGRSTLFTNYGTTADHSPAWNLTASNPTRSQTRHHSHTASASTGLTGAYKTTYAGTSRTLSVVQQTIAVYWITLDG